MISILFGQGAPEKDFHKYLIDRKGNMAASFFRVKLTSLILD